MKEYVRTILDYPVKGIKFRAGVSQKIKGMFEK